MDDGTGDLGVAPFMETPHFCLARNQEGFRWLQHGFCHVVRSFTGQKGDDVSQCCEKL